MSKEDLGLVRWCLLILTGSWLGWGLGHFSVGEFSYGVPFLLFSAATYLGAAFCSLVIKEEK